MSKCTDSISTTDSGLFVCYGSRVRHQSLSVRALESKAVLALACRSVCFHSGFGNRMLLLKSSSNTVQPTPWFRGNISVNINHWIQMWGHAIVACVKCDDAEPLSPGFTVRAPQDLLRMNILNLLTWLSLTILPLIHASSLSLPPCQILFQCAKQTKVTSCHPFFRVDQ